MPSKGDAAILGVGIDKIHHVDALTFMRSLQTGSVHSIVTSPPYFRLRDYGVDGQIGREATLNEYLDRLEAIFVEALRVLHPAGTLWINIGDTYSSHRSGKTHDPFAKSTLRSFGTAAVARAARQSDDSYRTAKDIPEKSLLGVPWRLALRLMDAGWILRSEIIWHKPSGIPESAKDRPSRCHETIFMFAKQHFYFFDDEAIRQPAKTSSIEREKRARSGDTKFAQGAPGQRAHTMHHARPNDPDRDVYTTVKARTVWTIATEKLEESHYAAFPSALAERMIRAGCPLHVCTACGDPYMPVVETALTPQQDVSAARVAHRGKLAQESGWKNAPRGHTEIISKRFEKVCACEAGTGQGVVLDPFMGSATVALVARDWGRHYLGCDLNPEYVAMANRRLAEPYQIRLMNE